MSKKIKNKKNKRPNRPTTPTFTHEFRLKINAYQRRKLKKFFLKLNQVLMNQFISGILNLMRNLMLMH